MGKRLSFDIIIITPLNGKKDKIINPFEIISLGTTLGGKNLTVKLYKFIEIINAIKFHTLMVHFV